MQQKSRKDIQRLIDLCGSDNPKFVKALKEYLDKQKKLLLEESDDDYWSEEEEVDQEGAQSDQDGGDPAQPPEDGAGEAESPHKHHHKKGRKHGRSLSKAEQREMQRLAAYQAKYERFRNNKTRKSLDSKPDWEKAAFDISTKNAKSPSLRRLNYVENRHLKEASAANEQLIPAGYEQALVQ